MAEEATIETALTQRLRQGETVELGVITVHAIEPDDEDCLLQREQDTGTTTRHALKPRTAPSSVQPIRIPTVAGVRWANCETDLLRSAALTSLLATGCVGSRLRFRPQR